VQRAVGLAHKIDPVERVGGEGRHTYADRKAFGPHLLVSRQQMPLGSLDDALRQGLRTVRVAFE